MPDCDKPMICSACCCFYTACDFDDVSLLCHHSSDCLCIRSSSCCAMGVEPRGVGCTADKSKDECCMIGLYCCDCGIVTPKVLCASYRKCLCLQGAAACPGSPAYMDDFVCALYCLACAPQCGCCVTAPECPAIDMVKAGQSVDPKAVSSEPKMDR
uniref:Uncharacterized protein n=1 Tax=Entomoneis paludosa TaxID=265537 RepID=A0A7S3DUT9_9STRA|mmetsp:Transcript_3893/g.8347  ORF Transcript_3893/g.8347 Transcript_3893/m.8347 type:complete len:156 (+) Transcript_3893:168-635(+)